MAKRDLGRNTSLISDLIPFLLVSIFLHGLVFLIKIDFADTSEEHLVNIKYYNGAEFPENQKTVKQPVPEEIKEQLMNGQVVDIAKPEIEKKPDKSKFLSEYDSSVEKESKSDFDPVISIRDKKLRKKLSIEASKEKNSENETLITGSENEKLSQDLEKIKKGELKGFEGSEGNYTKGSEKEISGEVFAKDKMNQDGTQYVGGHRIPSRFLPYLNGNDSALTSPSNDFLKDIETSNETLLNTNKFVYAAYFNKLKQAISKHWTPSFVLIINDPGAQIYGKKDRYTKLIVKIYKNGTLKSASVETSSGVDFLDREAINAFKMAAPFSNPPEVLLNKDGVLEIHFGFMVTMQ